MAVSAAVSAATAFETLKVASDHTLQLQVYKNVTNASELRQSLAGPNLRNVALINASMVAGRFHTHLAAFKAAQAASRGNMTTQNLHTELVYCLAGTAHVGASLKRCGLSDDTQHVLVAMFDAPPDEVATVAKMVQGTPIPLDQIQEVHQPGLIQQEFKLTAEELQVGSLEDGVVAKMAVRDC